MYLAHITISLSHPLSFFKQSLLLLSHHVHIQIVGSDFAHERKFAIFVFVFSSVLPSSPPPHILISFLLQTSLLFTFMSHIYEYICLFIICGNYFCCCLSVKRK